jgi:TRAP-type mannitol/chloroaromatic compound transport system permease small subunit
VLAFIYFIDKISAWIGKAFAWCVVIMTLGISYEVFVRYLPRVFRSLGIDGAPVLRDLIPLMTPTPWAFDMSYIMYGALFMMAGAYTLSRDAHVRADMFYRMWPPRVQARLELLLYFIFFYPGVIALIFYGWDYAADSFRYREVSINSPAGIPIYQLKFIIPAAGLALAVQGLAQMARCIVCIRTGQWPPLLPDVEETESILVHTQEDIGDKPANIGASRP